MQRCCSKLARTLFSSSSSRHLPPLPAKVHLHVSPTTAPRLSRLGFRPPPSRPPTVFPAIQMRHFAAKAKDRSRAPRTPIVSKVKKYKMKCPSSMKFRFKTLKDGTIRRWHSGKRHNAHLKSKIAKRRLRLPALVHPAYAKVIKKLNFCG